MAHPKSHTLAIAAKCWDCQGRDYDPGVRWRIGNCEVGPARREADDWTGCPIYAFRPYRHLHGTRPGMAAADDSAGEEPQEGPISTDPLPLPRVDPDRALAEPAPRPTAVEEGRP